MPLTLIDTPSSSLGAIQAFLSTLGWAGDRVPLDELAFPESRTNSWYLGVFQSPEWAVGHALSLESPVEQAVEAWVAEATAFVEAVRAMPERVLLVQDRTLVESGGELEAELKARFPSLQLTASEGGSNDELPLEPGKPAASWLVLARQVVNASETVQTVWAELQSLAWYPSKVNDGVRSGSRLVGEEAVPLLEAKIQDLEAELELVKEDKAELEGISNDILQQLFKVQEELESRVLYSHDLRERARVANRDKLSAERRLHAIERSVFWRVTGPLRRFAAFGLMVLRKVKRRLAR